MLQHDPSPRAPYDLLPIIPTYPARLFFFFFFFFLSVLQATSACVSGCGLWTQTAKAVLCRARARLALSYLAYGCMAGGGKGRE